MHALASILSAPRADLDDHIKKLANGTIKPIDPAATVADATGFIAGWLASFFGQEWYPQ